MIQIKHRTTGAVLLSVDAPSLRGYRTQSAKLAGADFSGQDLDSFPILVFLE